MYREAADYCVPAKHASYCAIAVTALTVHDEYGSKTTLLLTCTDIKYGVVADKYGIFLKLSIEVALP